MSEEAKETKKTKQLTIPELQAMKGRGEKIVVVPVWDYNTTVMAEEAGADIVSVGGASAAMMMGGEPHALRASMEDVLFLLRRVTPAVQHALLFAAMPCGSFHISNEQAVRNAVRLVKAGAHCVKMQASEALHDRVKAAVDAGIQCVGHVGLLPQYIHKLGRFRVVGKTSEEALTVYKEVKELEEIGVWAIEMECVPAKVAEEISRRARIPVLGIGSGPGTDGQILALVDILGLQRTIMPKFTKRYADLWPVCINALKEYTKEVKTKAFPTEKHSFSISGSEFGKFMEMIKNGS